MTMKPRFTPVLQAALSTVEELERNMVRVINVMVMFEFGDAQRVHVPYNSDSKRYLDGRKQGVHVSYNSDSKRYLDERKQGESTSGVVTESWYVSEQGVIVFWMTFSNE